MYSTLLNFGGDIFIGDVVQFIDASEGNLFIDYYCVELLKWLKVNFFMNLIPCFVALLFFIQIENK